MIISRIQNQIMVDYFLSTFNFLEEIESDRLVSLSLCYYCFYYFEIVSMERDSIVKHPKLSILGNVKIFTATISKR